MIPLSHTQKKRRARIWLAVVFLALTAANALFLQFAFHPFNPYPQLRGLVIGAMLWSLVLIVIIWRRQAWARYVLLTLMIGTVAGFALALLMISNNRLPITPDAVQPAAIAIGLYLAALVPLVGSRSIHHLMGPMTAAGQ